MKRKLLVVELWGVGDLALAAPFLTEAVRHYAVTLLAKPAARVLVERFFPAVTLLPATLPWTAFRHKYQLHSWPWRELRRVAGQLRAERFEAAVSARWDPRDHLLLRLSGARRRVGFARLGSGGLLTDRLPRPALTAHRHEYWRVAGTALGVELPTREKVVRPANSGRLVVVHTGASQLTKVWPLERYRKLVVRLRELNYGVQVLCDPEQLGWWQEQGEAAASVPGSLDELAGDLESAGCFIGNDSGPGHVAALGGVPTFTIFGNQFSGRFAPVHSRAEWIEGKPCAYKPCYDRCRFPVPHCLYEISEAEVWAQVEPFLRRNMASRPGL